MSSKRTDVEKVMPVDADTQLRRHSTVAEGVMESAEDAVNRDLYGSSISDAYRMKSELITHHIAIIGMGK